LLPTRLPATTSPSSVSSVSFDVALLFALLGGSWLPPLDPVNKNEKSKENCSLLSADDVMFTEWDVNPLFSPEVVAGSSVSLLEVLQL
jgi:hypothetical protein